MLALAPIITMSLGSQVMHIRSNQMYEQVDILVKLVKGDGNEKDKDKDSRDPSLKYAIKCISQLLGYNDADYSFDIQGGDWFALLTDYLKQLDHKIKMGQKIKGNLISLMEGKDLPLHLLTSPAFLRKLYHSFHYGIVERSVKSAHDIVITNSFLFPKLKDELVDRVAQVSTNVQELFKAIDTNDVKLPTLIQKYSNNVGTVISQLTMHRKQHDASLLDIHKQAIDAYIEMQKRISNEIVTVLVEQDKLTPAIIDIFGTSLTYSYERYMRSKMRRILCVGESDNIFHLPMTEDNVNRDAEKAASVLKTFNNTDGEKSFDAATIQTYTYSPSKHGQVTDHNPILESKALKMSTPTELYELTKQFISNIENSIQYKNRVMSADQKKMYDELIAYRRFLEDEACAFSLIGNSHSGTFGLANPYLTQLALLQKNRENKDRQIASLIEERKKNETEKEKCLKKLEVSGFEALQTEIRKIDINLAHLAEQKRSIETKIAHIEKCIEPQMTFAMQAAKERLNRLCKPRLDAERNNALYGFTGHDIDHLAQYEEKNREQRLAEWALGSEHMRSGSAAWVDKQNLSLKSALSKTEKKSSIEIALKYNEICAETIYGENEIASPDFNQTTIEDRRDRFGNRLADMLGTVFAKSDKKANDPDYHNTAAIRLMCQQAARHADSGIPYSKFVLPYNMQIIHAAKHELNSNFAAMWGFLSFEPIIVANTKKKILDLISKIRTCNSPMDYIAIVKALTNLSSGMSDSLSYFLKWHYRAIIEEAVRDIVDIHFCNPSVNILQAKRDELRALKYTLQSACYQKSEDMHKLLEVIDQKINESYRSTYDIANLHMLDEDKVAEIIITEDSSQGDRNLDRFYRTLGTCIESAIETAKVKATGDVQIESSLAMKGFNAAANAFGAGAVGSAGVALEQAYEQEKASKLISILGNPSEWNHFIWNVMTPAIRDTYRQEIFDRMDHDAERFAVFCANRIMAALYSEKGQQAYLACKTESEKISLMLKAIVKGPSDSSQYDNEKKSFEDLVSLTDFIYCGDDHARRVYTYASPSLDEKKRTYQNHCFFGMGTNVEITYQDYKKLAKDVGMSKVRMRV